MAILTTTTGPQEAIDYINGKFDKTVGHSHDDTDENGGQIDSQNIKNTPNGDITATNTQEAINQIASFTSLGRVHVPVRQTVLSGITTNGIADFLQIGTGLSINLLASATPLILAFAYGFDTKYGQIDYVSSITSDQTAFWSNLPANKSFIQLYIDRNLSTGVLTGGYTERETAYGIAPPHFDTQHWYDYSNTTFMKVSNGTSWSNVQRIMVGECVTGASTVTNVICYAMQGKYDSGWFPVAANTNYTKNHNIGIKIPDGLHVQFYFSMDAAGNDASFAHDLFTYEAADYGHYIVENVAQNTRNQIKFGFRQNIQNYRGTGRASGYYRVCIKRTW
jgi:hypothetical protein